MNKSANKGEWSEVYALFKLLTDKELSGGDADLNKIESLVYPILKIIRSDENKIVNYEYNTERNIVFISSEGRELAKISVNDFAENAEKLLACIKSSKGSAFEIPCVTDFRLSTHVNSIKADSYEKADIHIVVHDPRTGQAPDLGFSIKSELGSAPTLLNPGKPTNFIYELSQPLSKEQVQKVYKTKNISEKIDIIHRNSSRLSFIGIEPSAYYGGRFFNNLVLIDYCMPRLVAHILLTSYMANEKNISKLVDIVKRQNPLKLDMADNQPYYECKIKRLLTDIALGMTPAKPWNGIYQANGGYLVVRESGDIICYHIYNKKEFEDYLFYNTKLDTPSTTRYNFGNIEGEEKQTFKLNLQIRFIK